ncbi:234_t:CDS:1 [Paraglomus occultum]|uniref:234_t:CDS:1 n=1 Tax=Paraglomus occultum TaxID=144539 RepID=A0A9N8Z8V8_9GLOM|nr:234_t:CDS:1 [Paraglomus occultum]
MSLWQQNYSRFSTSYLPGRHHHDLDILNNSSLNFARPESPLASHTAQTAVARKELREQPRLKIDTNIYNASPSQYVRRWHHNGNKIINNNKNNSNNNGNNKGNNSNNKGNRNDGNSGVKPTSFDKDPSQAVGILNPSAVHTPPNCEPKAWWPQQQSQEHKVCHLQEDDLTRAHIKRHKISHALLDKYKGEQLKPGVHAVRFAIDMPTDESIQSSNSYATSPQDIESNRQMQSQELRINNSPFIRRASATEQGSYAYFSAPANTNPLLSVTFHNPADDNRHALRGALNGEGFNEIGMSSDKQAAGNMCSSSNMMNATPSLSPCSSTSSLNSTGALTPATAMMDKSHDAYSESPYQDSLYSSSPSNISSRSSPFLTTSYLPQGFQTNPFTENATNTNATNTNALASSHSSVRPKAKSISVENPSTDRRRAVHHSFSCPGVTRDSYSSVPWSPAVSFLANLADATVKTPLPDDEGQQVREYILGKVIGRGGFSTVREAYDGMDKLAVKIVKNNPENPDNDRIQTLLEREVTIWRALDHPNVVKMISVEETDYATFVFAEYCSGGTLLNYIKSFDNNRPGIPESMAHEIFKQIASSVRYLHKDMRLVHKDIKLDNILHYGDGIWKLGDFGLTEFQNAGANGFSNVSDDKSDPAGGSLAYCSPEQLRSKTSIRDPKSDIWSLGVVLYAMLTGQLPFNDAFQPRLQFKILNGRYDESLLDDANVSEDCKDLLRRMFKPKPEQRIDITEVMNSRWYLRAH